MNFSISNFRVGISEITLFFSISTKILLNRLFPELAKSSANCHLANDWVSLAELVLYMVTEHWPHNPGVGGLNPSRGGGIFLIFKNYLYKLPIGNEFE